MWTRGAICGALHTTGVICLSGITGVVVMMLVISFAARPIGQLIHDQGGLLPILAPPFGDFPPAREPPPVTESGTAIDLAGGEPTAAPTAAPTATAAPPVTVPVPSPLT